jgi:hypothetical protein
VMSVPGCSKCISLEGSSGLAGIPVGSYWEVAGLLTHLAKPSASSKLCKKGSLSCRQHGCTAVHCSTRCGLCVSG